jgi:multiple sugar transport system permease protein
MIMPATALVLPLFLEASAIHLVGTVWSVILPFAFFPFGVYLSYIYFSSSIPKDLLAAARIDGAREWGVFRHVALPLARPIVALVGFFAFVADWNNYYLPFVMTSSNTQYPVPIGLQILISSTPVFSPTASGSASTELFRPDLAMATMISIAPVLVVFLFAQRTLVAGMLAGATKE